ncbi:uncharacterized protein BO97DRAFT_43110 [Aspergillus homomorphus CBS 101889]|uniref:Uncharacterized protein n=1 Tax=Aspergillus homomorphus (strain CBS 101889) TaxID=1450537 RepID=A0A395I086_ASPHC|nr:hypothetical protein BO97DRAFT_43110 [Aspergillus homomorphus CBS 101889]RAL13043.1 hypothetical protein BO97DRAFT_43110 [Aspergillus homomorphus CBS 101889]
MIVKLLFIAIFTFVSTLSPPVLALPSEPESGNGMPPSVGLLPLIKYLQRLGIAGVKLDRTLQTSKFDPDSLQNIGRLSDDIEDLVTQATGEAATLEVLDPIRSSQLTKNALLMKPVFGHLLNVIAMEVSLQLSPIWSCQEG